MNIDKTNKQAVHDVLIKDLRFMQTNLEKRTFLRILHVLNKQKPNKKSI